MTRKICAPLEEDSFRPILHHYDGPKFRLELNIPEVISFRRWPKWIRHDVFVKIHCISLTQALSSELFFWWIFRHCLSWTSLKNKTLENNIILYRQRDTHKVKKKSWQKNRRSKIVVWLQYIEVLRRVRRGIVGTGKRLLIRPVWCIIFFTGGCFEHPRFFFSLVWHINKGLKKHKLLFMSCNQVN
jgi:hypothetical protein